MLKSCVYNMIKKDGITFFIKQSLMGIMGYLSQIRKTNRMIQRCAEINGKNKKKSSVKRCGKKLKRYFCEYKYRKCTHYVFRTIRLFVYRIPEDLYRTFLFKLSQQSDTRVIK